jgi:hypothetical protein
MKITLGEVKQRVFRLIEEIDTDDTENYTNDIDYKAKINMVINQVLNELYSVRKKLNKEELEVEENQEYILDEELPDFYLLNKITGVDYDILENYVTFKEKGTAQIYYYTFPKQINQETTNDYKFNLDYPIIEALVVGAASVILMSDVSSNYGSVYANRYQELKQQLDPRFARTTYTIEGGVDI